MRAKSVEPAETRTPRASVRAYPPGSIAKTRVDWHRVSHRSPPGLDQRRRYNLVTTRGRRDTGESSRGRRHPVEDDLDTRETRRQIPMARTNRPATAPGHSIKSMGVIIEPYQSEPGQGGPVQLHADRSVLSQQLSPQFLLLIRGSAGPILQGPRRAYLTPDDLERFAETLAAERCSQHRVAIKDILPSTLEGHDVQRARQRTLPMIQGGPAVARRARQKEQLNGRWRVDVFDVPGTCHDMIQPRLIQTAERETPTACIHRHRSIRSAGSSLAAIAETLPRSSRSSRAGEANTE